MAISMVATLVLNNTLGRLVRCLRILSPLMSEDEPLSEIHLNKNGISSSENAIGLFL